MNKIIPISFTLGGTDYKVETVDNLLVGDNVAYIDYPSALIRIGNQYKGLECTNDYKSASFLHELVHGILDSIGKVDISNDESFVEGFANSMHQYLKTAKYE